MSWSMNGFIQCLKNHKSTTELYYFLFFFFKKISLFVYLFIYSVFLGPHSWHMEVPRLGIQLELQLLACTTATAIPDPSCVCDLRHSSRQCRTFSPLSKARDRTYNLMVPSGIRWRCATMGTPRLHFLKRFTYPCMAKLPSTKSADFF